MDNDHMEGLLEGMEGMEGMEAMEGMEGMEAMEAAMENEDTKQGDGPNTNTSQTKEQQPSDPKEIQVDFSQDKSKFLQLIFNFISKIRIFPFFSLSEHQFK